MASSSSPWYRKSSSPRQQQNGHNESTTNGDSWAEQEEAFFGTPSPSPASRPTPKSMSHASVASSSHRTPTIASIPPPSSSSSTASSSVITSKSHKDSTKKRAQNLNGRSGWFGQISNGINSRLSNLSMNNATPTIAMIPPKPPPPPPRTSNTPPQQQQQQQITVPTTFQIRPPPITKKSTTPQNIPNCLICGSFHPSLPGSTYKYHPYFTNERMCPSHSSYEMSRCCSCTRYGPSPYISSNPKARKFVETNDHGRMLCYPCAETSVGDVDTSEAKILWGTVLFVLKIKLKLELWKGFEEDFPVKLVGHVYLNDHHDDNDSDDKGGNTFHTRGLCTYTYPPPKITSIQCLKNLPKSLSGSILAHEATHAWFKLHPSNRDLFRGGVGGSSSRGTLGLPQMVEEGCCQLVAFLYLGCEEELASSCWDKISPSYMSKRQQQQQQQEGGFVDEMTNERLRQFFRNSIETDTTPVYGDGFREAARAYEKMGCCLRSLLDYVVEHHCFPP